MKNARRITMSILISVVRNEHDRRLANELLEHMGWAIDELLENYGMSEVEPASVIDRIISSNISCNPDFWKDMAQRVERNRQLCDAV